MMEEEEPAAPAQGSAAENSLPAGTPIAAPAARVLPPPLDSSEGDDECSTEPAR